MTTILTADGGSRGNPGPSAYGFGIWSCDQQEMQKDKLQDVIVNQEPTYCEGKYIGNTTNNQAEWQGLLAGLEYLKNQNLNLNNLIVALDSELVVKQITGVYKVKNPGLIPLFQQTKQLLKSFTSFEIVHIYRQYNKLADSKVNEALDQLD